MILANTRFMATLQANARAHSEIYAAGHPPGTMPMYPVIFIDMD